MRTFIRPVVILFVVLALCLLPLVFASCGTARRVAGDVAGDVVDCTSASARGLIDQFGPVVDAVLVAATGGDGKVDGAQLKTAVKNFGVDLGGCVLASSVRRALTPAPDDPAAPRLSPVQADPAALQALFEAIRKETLSGKRYKLAEGDL